MMKAKNKFKLNDLVRIISCKGEPAVVGKIGRIGYVEGNVVLVNLLKKIVTVRPASTNKYPIAGIYIKSNQVEHVISSGWDKETI